MLDARLVQKAVAVSAYIDSIEVVRHSPAIGNMVLEVVELEQEASVMVDAHRVLELGMECDSFRLSLNTLCAKRAQPPDPQIPKRIWLRSEWLRGPKSIPSSSRNASFAWERSVVIVGRRRYADAAIRSKICGS
jgi:hypothetical protein